MSAVMSPRWEAFCRACLTRADRLQSTRRYVTTMHGLPAWLQAAALGNTRQQRDDAAAQLRRIRGGRPLYMIRRDVAGE